jgi:hypothetical protein
MKDAKKNSLLLVTAVLGCLAHGIAQAAPGEDPISLSDPVQYASMPTPGPSTSGNLDGLIGNPAWAQARMSRYQAKAFSATADDGTIYTDDDVVTTVQRKGFQTTCTQEVGSVSGEAALGSQYGPNKREQIVVLRGDLVNVCK